MLPHESFQEADIATPSATHTDTGASVASPACALEIV